VTVGFDDWTAFKFLFAGQNSAGQNRIYAVNPQGQLLSYADSGMPGNVSNPVIVGFGGWTDFTFLFAGANVAGQGRIYAVLPNGQLLSYGDSGTPGNVSNPQVVGFGGWTDFKLIFAGRNVTGQDRIYGVWGLPTLPPGESLYAAVSSAYTSNIVESQGNELRNSATGRQAHYLPVMSRLHPGNERSGGSENGRLEYPPSSARTQPCGAERAARSY
jgi:hypothetical protein